MSDYWKSYEKHYCKDCNCYLDAKKMSVRRHTEGKRHKENVANRLKAARKSRLEKDKAEKDMDSVMAAIEKAAHAAHKEDLKAGHTGAGGGAGGGYGGVFREYRPAETGQPPPADGSPAAAWDPRPTSRRRSPRPSSWCSQRHPSWCSQRHPSWTSPRTPSWPSPRCAPRSAPRPSSWLSPRCAPGPPPGPPPDGVAPGPPPGPLPGAPPDAAGASPVSAPPGMKHKSAQTAKKGKEDDEEDSDGAEKNKESESEEKEAVEEPVKKEELVKEEETTSKEVETKNKEEEKEESTGLGKWQAVEHSIWSNPGAKMPLGKKRKKKEVQVLAFSHKLVVDPDEDKGTNEDASELGYSLPSAESSTNASSSDQPDNALPSFMDDRPAVAFKKKKRRTQANMRAAGDG
eukprot:g14664.t1